MLTIAVGMALAGIVVVALTGELLFFFYMLFYAAGPLYAGVHIGVQRWLWARKRDEWALRMKALGLEFRPRVTTRDVAPNRKLPLFSIGDPRRQRADFMARGVVEGQEIVVMNYRYADWFRTPKGQRFLRGAIQTIALFPHLEDLPDFHLAPAENDWNSLAPHWAEELNVGRVVRMVDGCDDDPLLIRTWDELVVMRLFDDERLERLGNLTGWNVESRDARVVIYRHGEVMSTDELPYFVQRALDIVGVLTDFDRKNGTPVALGDERILPGPPPRKWTERLRRTPKAPRRG
jgi:hypothetical protein